MKPLVAGRVSNIGVVLFTDIVKSVDLRATLGEDEFGKLKDEHDRLFESLLGTVAPQAEEFFIKSTGDGFLKLFKTAAEAVRFALLFQHALLTAPWNRGQIKVRVGINIGDVTFVQQPSGRDISGIAVDIAARVMSLAMGGQILMPSAAFNSARHNVKESGLGQLQKLKWIEHGAYTFQGWDKPMEIFEVGVEGVSPLRPPPGSDKAAPLDPDKQKKVMGWRPAEGQAVEGKSEWILERSIGAGGFGEAWLATHRALGTHTVFKFCFDNRTLESLQRETHIFRTLRKELGDRNDIAKLIDVRLEGEPPYYLQSDYAEGGDLRAWAQRQGSVGNVPLERRVGVVAQVAEALAAAHSVGVLHKDIKPANILMDEVRGPTGSGEVGIQQLAPKLSDFGIGEILEGDQSSGGPGAGSSGRMVAGQYATTTGFSPYIAPEVAVGGLPTTASDVYSLGVLLYQCAVGDLSSPFGGGWDREIGDPLLRADIAACTDKDSSKRISAGALAHNLRRLEDRRRQRRRRRNLRRAVTFAIAAVVGIAIGAAVVGINGYIEQKQRAEANLRIADDVKLFLLQMLQSTDPQRQTGASGGEVTLASLLDEGYKRIVTDKALTDQPEALSTVCLSLGNAYLHVRKPDKARDLFDTADAALGRANPPLEAPRRRIKLALAEAHLDRGSEQSLQAAARIVGEVESATMPDADSASLAAARARLAMANKDWAEAARQFQLAEKFYSQDPSSPAWKVTAAQIRGAQMLLEARSFTEALVQLDRLEQSLQLAGTSESPLLWSCRALRGKTLAGLGRFADAEMILRSVLERAEQREKLGASPLDTAYAAGDLAEVLEQAGKPAAAVRYRMVGSDLANRGDLPASLKAYFHARLGLVQFQVDKGLAIEPLEAAQAELGQITQPNNDDQALKNKVQEALARARLPGNESPGGQR